jgi:hypothetical protein
MYGIDKSYRHVSNRCKRGIISFVPVIDAKLFGQSQCINCCFIIKIELLCFIKSYISQLSSKLYKYEIYWQKKLVLLLENMDILSL